METKTKYTLAGALLLAVIAAILAANMASTGLFAMQQTKTITIGVTLPLTGDAATWGEETKKGVELAIDEIKNEIINGKKIEFIIEDDACDAKTALTAFNKLTNIDGTKIIAGTICSSAALAMAPEAMNNKILLMASGASSPKIRTAGEYIFSIWPPDDLEGKVMADYIVQKTNIKSAGIIFINNEYGAGLKDSFENSAKENGILIASTEAFEPGAKDFRTQLQKTKNALPDAIYIATNPGELPTILRQAKEMQLNKQIFSNSAAVEAKEITEDKTSVAEGVIYPLPKRELTQEFKDKYKSKYGTEAGFLSDTGYDSVKLIYLGLKACGDDNATCVKNYLLNVNNYQGASAALSFNGKTTVTMPFEIKEIKNGKSIVID